MACIKSIDYDIVEELYGNEFRTTLEKLKLTIVIDIPVLIAELRTWPIFDSIWRYRHGGTVDENVENVGRVYAYWGNLTSINNNKVPFWT
jgi:hypothetical protein